jgi:hypothetical protein
MQVSASYGQSMVLLHSYQRTPLASNLHSPRTSIVHRKVHVDLVAEAAPNLASIRTLLAEEIAEQAPLPPPLPPFHTSWRPASLADLLACLHGMQVSPLRDMLNRETPSTEGASQFFSRLSVRSRLARFRHRRRRVRPSRLAWAVTITRPSRSVCCAGR